MRILLDECVPSRLRRELPGHDVRTVPEMGWASRENGALLALAEGKFDVFLTTDQRISYQQAVSKFAIALVVLVARRNKIEFLLRMLPELQRVLGNVHKGLIPDFARSSDVSSSHAPGGTKTTVPSRPRVRSTR